ncbi:transglycosylase domain-containing protein [Novosphingobium sp. TH158]|uniref:transglycosylase domain-containing protein n=1 Tax=Novosphingobium sp. TH158 TaxID=2067455 RepID=UPI000C7DACD7|nr:PBP1A family penicillin-binding protein [Novosphingobium sp. TH158]PLK24428.1 penicillin-binding protein [Novosphingobium sp. TH158]
MARNATRQRIGSQGEPPPPVRVKKKRGWFRKLVIWGVALSLLGAIFLGVAVAVTMQSVPTYEELKRSQSGQTILVRARDGTELFNMGPSYGKWVPIKDLPKVMPQAMTSVEDRRFYSHIGIDPLGLIRAAFVSVTSGKSMRATSTITQQLARNLFLNNSRTLTRKVNEAVWAMALEARFSKEQILELYLNKVYFGGGAYGVDAASRKFFGHPASEITLPEAAIIAGLVKAPSHYSPTADAKAATDRAQVVLQTMVDNEVLTPSEMAAVDMSKVVFAPEGGTNSVRYFTDWALPQLDLLVPENTEPVEVWTTLDTGMQEAATKAVVANVPKGAQGALVSMDRDGAILAMVGGTDYVSSNYNRATLAVRQPGSAFKLFVYLAALEAGYKPDDAVVDEPVTIEGWSPRNSGGTFAGQIDVRTAFAYSKNTVAAQLGNEVGFGAIAGVARRFGITTPVNTMPSMVLGSSDVRVIDLTRAFATVSAKGVPVEPYGISKVVTTDGRMLYQRSAPGTQPIVPQYVIAGITDLLQTAVNIGTGKAAQIGRPVAGKTGTTSSNKDGWFLGFSSGITTGVWMGRDDAKPVPGLQGGTAPARAFAQFMKYAVAKRPVEKFDTELKLPAWQLEPDDEVIMADPNDYSFVDEQGNLIEPQEGQKPRPGDPAGRPEDLGLPPRAAEDDFLNEATGREAPKVRRGSQPQAN